MEWMACIDLPAFPLQLLLRREPSWRLHPAAVVESDRPGALLLHVNELAWQKRILPGMRYAAALSLSGDLRAAPISTRRIDSALSGMVRLLGRFSPEVEPDCDNPGLFWVNASGLVGLFDSFEEWARLIRADLSRNELEATVVIGFSRFATGVVAKARRGVTIFKNRAHEETAARAVPLDRLSISRSMGDILEKLGVTTLGAFADLPPEGIQKRFGKDAGRLHRLARGEEEDPFQPVEIREKPGNRDILEYAEKNLTRLIFLISRGLDPVLKQLADRDQALRDQAQWLHGVTPDYLRELSYHDRKTLHNFKYFTWVEQQGRSVEELRQLWDRDFWTETFNVTEHWDKRITEFNERIKMA